MTPVSPLQAISSCNFNNAKLKFLSSSEYRNWRLPYKWGSSPVGRWWDPSSFEAYWLPTGLSYFRTLFAATFATLLSCLYKSYSLFLHLSVFLEKSSLQTHCYVLHYILHILSHPLSVFRLSDIFSFLTLPSCISCTLNIKWRRHPSCHDHAYHC